MKTQHIRTGAVLAGGFLMAVLAVPAMANTDLHVSINLGNAPPPPVVVVQHAPRTEWLPEQRVYVANDPDFDDDYFQCGMFWYVNHGNYWYRARSWRGPYTVIETRYVPQSVMVVPARHWRHHPWGGPPGRAQYVERRPVPIERVRVKNGHDHDDRWRDDDRGHGHGDGHGKGHR